MPICFRDEDRRDHDGAGKEWREPPGWLGDIVKRVKALPPAPPRPGSDPRGPPGPP